MTIYMYLLFVCKYMCVCVCVARGLYSRSTARVMSHRGNRNTLTGPLSIKMVGI